MEKNTVAGLRTRRAPLRHTGAFVVVVNDLPEAHPAKSHWFDASTKVSFVHGVGLITENFSTFVSKCLFSIAIHTTRVLSTHYTLGIMH